MALTAEEQELLDLAKALLPDWFVSDDRVQEELGGAAKVMGAAKVIIKAWMDRARIMAAEGATATDPDWLNQHAVDRGTARQPNENDETLRARLRSVDNILTRPALLEGVAAILAGAGVAGTAAMVELRRDRIYLGKFLDRSGTGGTFAQVSGTTWRFTPTTAFGSTIEVGHLRSGSQGNPRLVISGAANAGNNGTFTVTALSGQATVFTNAAGVAATDATAAWSVRQYDVDGNARSSAAGLGRAFLGRGYRAGGPLPRFIVILPYGTSVAVAASVTEMLRVKKAAGMGVTVERRLNP